MTSLHQAIADNLILDPESEEWQAIKDERYVGCLLHGEYNHGCEHCQNLTAKAFVKRVNKGTDRP